MLKGASKKAATQRNLPSKDRPVLDLGNKGWKGGSEAGAAYRAKLRQELWDDLQNIEREAAGQGAASGGAGPSH